MVCQRGVEMFVRSTECMRESWSVYEGYLKVIKEGDEKV